MNIPKESVDSIIIQCILFIIFGIFVYNLYGHYENTGKIFLLCISFIMSTIINLAIMVRRGLND